MILCDNNGVVIIANKNRDVKSMMHCKRRLFYIQQLRQDKEVMYKYINNCDMVPDIGTKNLDATLLQTLIKMIMCRVEN